MKKRKEKNFLLTDNQTGVTTNLAVIPGTNDPISVYTVRDNQYNSFCTSENEQNSFLRDI